MTTATTAERVQKVVAEQLGYSVEHVKPEANITHDLGADSLDTVELAMAIEEEFNIEIDDAEAEKIKTVQGYIDLVERKEKRRA